MTGPGDPASGDPASDEDAAAFDDPAFDDVRALLAETRVTGPIPPEVAARLDDTLASLQAERDRPSAAPDDGVVVPLRRRVAPMIAAAAAVVVVAAGGVAIARAAQHRDGSANSTASADAAGSSASSAAPGSPTLPGAKSLAPSAGSVPAPQVPAIPGAATLALPRLESAAFASDAAAVMRSFADATRSTAPSELDSAGGASNQDTSGSLQAPPVTASPQSSTYESGPVAACVGPVVADAVVVPARLDGSLVALVFRSPTATAQEVEAWSCDGSARLASASVPH